MAKRFADEYKYTHNHVSHFITGNYSIIFYKNDSCLSQYKSNYSRIEFDICLQKIYENYNISAPLVAIIDRMGKYNNPSTEFFYFDPISGERLHTNFCDFLSYTVKKNISEINKNKFSYLIDKDIDIYNINSEFYTSNCNNYNRKFETDITLSYRLLYFYPQISICVSNCEYRRTDFKSLISYCECSFNENRYKLFNLNPEQEDEIIIQLQNTSISIYSPLLGIRETLEKNIFIFCFIPSLSPYHFIRNIGGLTILILLIIQIICVLLLIKKDYLNKITKFIEIIMDLYIKDMKNRKKNKMKSHQNNEKLTYNPKSNTEIEIDKNSLNSNSDGINRANTSPVHSKSKNNNRITIKKKIRESTKSLNDEITNISEDYTEKSFKISDMANIKKLKTLHEKKLKNKSILDLKNKNYFKKLDSTDGFNESDMKEYLSKSPDDLNFYKVLKIDKRTFAIEETKPFLLKIIFFTLHIDFYFFITTLRFSADDINYFYDNKKFKFFIDNISGKIIFLFPISKLLRFYLGLFLTDKYTIKDMIKLEKDDENKLKKATTKLVKCTKIKYIIFIIINIIITIISWSTINVFNYIYPNTKIYWFILCIILIIIGELLSVGLAFVETCLRFFSIKCKIKAIFTLSQYINELN